MKEQFVFEGKLRTGLIATIAIGLLLFIIGAVADGNIHRMWAVILQNSLFFTLVSLASVFFLCVHTLAFGGWYAILKRIPESISSFLPWGSAIIILLMILMYLDSKGILHTGISHLYHWMEPNITDPKSPNYDKIIDFKSGFLNWGSFIALTLIFIGGWNYLASRFRTLSLNDDREGGYANYKKIKVVAAWFALLFAVSSSVFSWLWLMSINVHWYSTLFGWYTFASFWVTGISVICLICIFLKEQGYLTFMNENHFHDLGKYMFGFSVFWTYLFFSQYMLIWYANIPEETAYFKYLRDTGGFRFWFWINLIINFAVPFLALMKRGFKRDLSRLKAIGLIIIFGHWLDYYLIIIPGSLKHNGQGSFQELWLMETGIVCFFVGLLLFVTFNYMSKVPLYARNNVFIKESLSHQI